MATTGWDEGPFTLTAETISKLVTKKSPGAYALGRLTAAGFYVDYVGRSDDDLANRLQNWVGEYPHFKAGYYPTAQAAFIKECELYHDFTGLHNKVHPARPAGTYWACPRCK